MQAEAQGLQQELRRHIQQLSRRIEHCENELSAAPSPHLSIPEGYQLKDFALLCSLQERIDKPKAANSGFGATGGFGTTTTSGFGGFGSSTTTSGFGGFGATTGGFGATTTQQQQKRELLGGVLEKILTWIQTQLRLIMATGYAGDGYGQQSQKLHILKRAKATLEMRKSLEQTMAFEQSGDQGQNMPTTFDTAQARIQQNRAVRQRFVRRLREIAKEDIHIAGGWQDADVLMHCVCALVEHTMRGGDFGQYTGTRAKSDWQVKANHQGKLLSYTHSRCPGVLKIEIKQEHSMGSHQYIVTHMDSDRGIHTQYAMTPGADGAMYEALLFFLLIFESAHQDKVRREHSRLRETTFAAMSRRFFEGSTSGV